MDQIRSFLEISRWRIQLVSLATILLGPLYAAGSLGDLLTWDLFLFAVLFIFSITFACNINCYHDLKVDSLRKKNLAHAVLNLGRKKLRKIMLIESIVVFLLVFILFLRGYIAVTVITLFGWILSYTYSSPPIRLKTRGVLSPIPVNIGVYVLPILAGHLIISSDVSLIFLLFILGYALLNLGINLVNVAEDHREDKKCGIKTISHVVGIKNTMVLSSLTIILGSIIILFSLYSMVNNLTSGFVYTVMLICLLTAFLDITSVLKHKNIERKTKEKGARLPLYFVSTRYPMVVLLLINLL